MDRPPVGVHVQAGQHAPARVPPPPLAPFLPLSKPVLDRDANTYRDEGAAVQGEKEGRSGPYCLMNLSEV